MDKSIDMSNFASLRENGPSKPKVEAIKLSKEEKRYKERFSASIQ
jgi:hypothetical protein